MLHYQSLGEEASFPGAQVWNEGQCGEGDNRVVCRQWGDEYVCVACAYPEIDIIQGGLQQRINAVAALLGITIHVATDGQIGWRTTEALGILGKALAARFSANSVVAATMAAALATPQSPTTIRQVAMTTAEVANYLGVAGDALRAGQNPPPVVPVPVVPGPGAEPVVTLPTTPARPARYKAAFAVMAVLATVGLVGTGIYYQKYYRRGY